MTAVAGTGPLVRLALRRDRIILPAWLYVLVLSAASSAAATKGIYPTVASRVQAAVSINNTPSLVALYGRIYDDTSLGEVSLIKMSGLGAVLVAILVMLNVVRHTRAEEESGRLELLGATVVGRYAALCAALLVAVGTSVVLGLLTTVALIVVGLPVAGSIAFGLAWAGIGIAFAGIAAFTAQLTRSSRTANGISATVLALVYLLRAMGDTAGVTGPRWLSWLSPIGWSQQIRPYANERWWVLGITLVFAVLVIGAAVALVSRRDLDAGLLADRPGPATARPRLRGPFALAWRLNRAALAAWTAGFLLVGMIFGSVATNVGSFLDSPQARDFILKLGGEQGLTDAFLATELGMLAVIVSVYGIQVALRLRSEETALRAEPLLATATGRTRWAASYIVMALGGSAVLMVAAGIGGGLLTSSHSGDARDFWRVLGAAVAQLPASWVAITIVVALFGLAPRLVTAGWAALVLFLLLGEFAPLLNLGQWAMDISPFTHVPKLPGAAATATPFIWLAVVAAALTSAGLVGFRRRDIG